MALSRMRAQHSRMQISAQLCDDIMPSQIMATSPDLTPNDGVYRQQSQSSIVSAQRSAIRMNGQVMT